MQKVVWKLLHFQIINPKHNMIFKSDMSPKHIAFVYKISKTHNKHWQSLAFHFHLFSQAIQLSKYVLFIKKHRI